MSPGDQGRPGKVDALRVCLCHGEWPCTEGVESL